MLCHSCGRSRTGTHSHLRYSHCHRFRHPPGQRPGCLVLGRSKGEDVVPTAALKCGVLPLLPPPSRPADRARAAVAILRNVGRVDLCRTSSVCVKPSAANHGANGHARVASAALFFVIEVLHPRVLRPVTSSDPCAQLHLRLSSVLFSRSMSDTFIYWVSTHRILPPPQFIRILGCMGNSNQPWGGLLGITYCAYL
jgi:hypothetical protein